MGRTRPGAFVPTVTSVKRIGANPAAGATVQWVVEFSETVAGFDVTDLNLVATGVDGASITSVDPNGAARTFIVNVHAGTATTCSATLRLDVIANGSVYDAGDVRLAVGRQGEAFSIPKAAGCPPPTAPQDPGDPQDPGGPGDPNDPHDPGRSRRSERPARSGRPERPARSERPGRSGPTVAVTGRHHPPERSGVFPGCG